jgi:hypothetical protein
MQCMHSFELTAVSVADVRTRTASGSLANQERNKCSDENRSGYQLACGSRPKHARPTDTDKAVKDQPRPSQIIPILPDMQHHHRDGNPGQASQKIGKPSVILQNLHELCWHRVIDQTAECPGCRTCRHRSCCGPFRLHAKHRLPLRLGQGP